MERGSCEECSWLECAADNAEERGLDQATKEASNQSKISPRVDVLAFWDRFMVNQLSINAYFPNKQVSHAHVHLLLLVELCHS